MFGFGKKKEEVKKVEVNVPGVQGEKVTPGSETKVGEKDTDVATVLAKQVKEGISDKVQQKVADKVTDEVADKIQKEAIDNTIILTCRKHADGTLSWSIPNNLGTASFLLKVLDVTISQMLKMALQPKQPKILTPGTKIIKPN